MPAVAVLRPRPSGRPRPRLRPLLRAAVAGGRLDRADAQALAAGALELRRALHDAVDVVALEDLVVEQGAGEVVELVAVLQDQLHGAAHRLVGEVLLLLVA